MEQFKISEVGSRSDWASMILAIDNKTNGFDLSTALVDVTTKRAHIGDEIFWNTAAPTGDALTKLDAALEAKGWSTGVIITPAIFMNIDWANGTSTFKTDEEIVQTIAALSTEVAKVDFVGVDPYKGIIPGVSDEWLLAFTHIADDWIKAQGKEAHLVVQGFARHGDECETMEFIAKQIAGQDYDEVIVFDLEDATDLSRIDFVGINPVPMLVDLGGI